MTAETSHTREMREETTVVKQYINSRPDSSSGDSWKSRGRQQQQDAKTKRNITLQKIIEFLDIIFEPFLPDSGKPYY